MKNLLLIGGPLDGQRQKVKDNIRILKCPIHRFKGKSGRAYHVNQRDAIKEPEPVKLVTYKRIELGGSEFFLCHPLDQNEAIQLLLTNYQP